MKHIAAAVLATAFTLATGAAASAQSAVPATQHAMHATATQAHTTHNTAAPAHAAHTSAAPAHAKAAGSHVPESRARHAALAAVAHGRVRSHRLTHENGKLVYVYTLSVAGHGGTQKVTVDANTGAVISNEHMAAAGAAHTHRAAAHAGTTSKMEHHRR